MDADDLRERLEQRLMSHGVYVTSLDRREGRLHVEYETAASGAGVPQREIGRVLNLLLDALDDGWEPADVRGTVHRLDVSDGDDPESSDRDDSPTEENGSVRGTWRADADWLRAHARGEISDVELSQRVLDTVEES